MTPSRTNNVSLLFATIFISLCTACHDHTTASYADIDSTTFRNGDLLFRVGSSIESQAVVLASAKDISHVGILLKHNNQWCVVHAVPGETDDEHDTVKIEPINDFLQSDRCLSAMSSKVDCTDSIANNAALYAVQKIGMPFDNDYELNDTSRYYCTELVWQAYLHQGIDITRGRRHRSYILPEDVIQR